MTTSFAQRVGVLLGVLFLGVFFFAGVASAAVTLQLNGDNPLKVHVGDSFSDPGGRVIDGAGQPTSFADAGVSVSGPVDTNTLGFYTVTYSYAGSIAKRIVIVYDDPTITLNATSPVNLEYGTPFVDQGGTVTDPNYPAASWSDVQIIKPTDFTTKLPGDQTYVAYTYTSPVSGAVASVPLMVNIVTPTTNALPVFIGTNPLNYTREQGTGLIVRDVVHCYDPDGGGFGVQTRVNKNTYEVSSNGSPAEGITATTPVGDYTFRVECKDADGDYAISPAIVNIKVVPPGSTTGTSTGTTTGISGSSTSLGTGTPGSGLVPCDGPDCDACSLVKLGNNVFHWLVGVLFIIFAIIIAVGGFGLVTSGGNPAAKSAAKNKITNAVIGIVIVFAAWLLVDTIIKGLVQGGTGEINGTFWYTIKCGSQTLALDTPSARIATPSGVDCNNTSDLISTYNGSGLGVVAAETTTMKNCYMADPAIAAALDMSQVFTTDRSHPTCAATNGNPVCSPCSHSINSCHYGRGTGQGALAVDFNANGTVTEAELCSLIKARQPSCGGRVLCESDHTHVSAPSCP